MPTITWYGNQNLFLNSRRVNGVWQQARQTITFGGTQVPASALSVSAKFDYDDPSPAGQGSYTVAGESHVYNARNYAVAPPAAGAAALDIAFAYTGYDNIQYDHGLTIQVISPKIVITYEDGKVGPPGNVQLSAAVANTDVVLSWTAASSSAVPGYTVDGYTVMYRDSADGVNWTDFQLYGSTAGINATSIVVSPAASYGWYRQFAIAAICSQGDAYCSDWVASPVLQRSSTTPCSAPTSISVAPIAAAATTLSWDGAAGGVNNGITHFLVQRKYGNNEWMDLERIESSASGGSITVQPHDSPGETYYYRVQTQGAAGAMYYSPYSAVVSLRRKAKPTMPTGLTLTLDPPDPYYIHQLGDIVLAWTASQDGDDGQTIANYHLQYRTRNSRTAEWTAWADYGVIQSTTATITPSAGAQVQYRVCAVDTYGVYGDYAEFPVVTQNSPPAAPVVTTLPALYESGAVTLTWQTAADIDGDPISWYNVAYHTRPDSQSDWSADVEVGNTTSTSMTVTPPVDSTAFARGCQIEYLVRAVDSHMAVGNYASFGVVTRNQQPTAPVPDDSSHGNAWSSGPITLRWSRSTDDNLDHYTIQQRTYKSSTSRWSDYSDVTTVAANATSVDVTPTTLDTTGDAIQYRICAVDTMNAASDYGYFSPIGLNVPPSFLIDVDVSCTLYDANSIVLSWTAATATTSPINRYEIACVVSNNAYDEPSFSTVVASTPATATSFTIPATAAYLPQNQGDYAYLAVRAVDELGDASKWTAAPPVRKNVRLTDFSIVYPAADNMTCRTGSPVFGIRFPLDPDGSDREVTVAVTPAGASEGESTLVDEMGFVDSAEQTLVHRLAATLTPGSYTARFRAKDVLSPTSAFITKSINFTIVAPSWTRAIARGTPISVSDDSYADGVLTIGGSTVTGEIIEIENSRVDGTILTVVSSSGTYHIPDMTELLNAVNERRAWFNKDAASYTGTVGRYSKWLDHMKQMYAAIKECYTIAGETPADLALPPDDAPIYTEINATPPTAPNAPTAATINAIRALVDGM